MFSSTHCDTPLTFNHARKALLIPQFSQTISDKNPCRRELLSIQELFSIPTPQVGTFAHIQYNLQNLWTPSHNDDCVRDLLQSLKIASESISLQINAFNHSLNILLPNIEYDSKILEQLIPSYLRRACLEEGVLLSGSICDKSGYWWEKVDKFAHYSDNYYEIIVGKNLVCFKDLGIWYVMSREHLVLQSDLASQRHILRVVSLLASLNKVPGILEFTHLTRLFQNGDSILRYGGNSVYSLVYSLESSCISRLINNHHTNDQLIPGTFRYAIWSKIRRQSETFNVLPLIIEREDLLDEIHRKDVSHLTQVYGLYRIWGHPTLDPLDAALELKRIGTKFRTPILSNILKIDCKFKEEFIIRYIAKHLTWPKLNTSKLSEFSVIKIAYENNLEYPLSDKFYDRSHLSLVSFDQLFPVDPKFDLIELINDKSLSLNEPELVSNITHKHNIGTSLQRSLLLKWLDSDLIDPEVFLKHINDDGFPTEEVCVGIHEKEREGKLIARMFGLLTLEKRTYVVLTEKLISEHILPLFPEVTMTDDENTLDKKRRKFTSRHQEEQVLYISIDFEKWNTNMREEETLTFFKTFDNLFGFQNVFQRTHELFYGSFLYLIDGSFLPPTENGHLKEGLGCWKGHLGGIEGLRQKGWTLWSFTLISLIAENFPFHMEMMAQGDNKILRLSFSSELTEDETLSISKEFLRSLNAFLSETGPPLKLEETWISNQLYLYGKYPILNGVALPLSMKKVCRMFRLSNEDYPTLESALSSLAANVFSAVASDNSILIHFFIYLMEVIGCFQNFSRLPYIHFETPDESLERNSGFKVHQGGTLRTINKTDQLKTEHKLTSNKNLKLLTLFPRSLGGYPVVMLIHLMVKGFPDQLAQDVDLLMAIIRSCDDPPLQTSLWNFLNPPFSNDLDFALLAENPSALNLLSPPTPSEARRGKIIQYLKETPRISNPYIKEFIDLVDRKKEEDLISYLCSPSSIHPKVLELFIQSTCFFRARQVVNKLQKTPTIAKSYLMDNDDSLAIILSRSEMNHFKFIYWRINHILTLNKPDFTLCVMFLTKQLRNLGWKKEILGVDCAPFLEILTVEPLNQVTGCNPKLNVELKHGEILVSLASSVVPQIRNPGLTIGPYKPYRGGTTRSKNESIGKFVSHHTTPLLSKVLSLASNSGWAYETNSTLDNLARQLVGAVTDTPFDILTPSLDQIAGSIHHRLKSDRMDEGGVSPVLPNHLSKIFFDTSYLIGLGKGSKNVNFLFQGCMILISSILSEIIQRNLDLPRSLKFHIHFKTSCCIQETSELVESPSEEYDKTIHSNPHSPFLWFSFDKTIQPFLSTLSFVPSNSSFFERDIDIYRFHMLTAYEATKLLKVGQWSSLGCYEGNEELPVNSARSLNLVLFFDYLSLLIIAILGEFKSPRTMGQSLMGVINLTFGTNLSYFGPLANLIFHSKFPYDLFAAEPGLCARQNEITSVQEVSTLVKSFLILRLKRLFQPFNFERTFLWGPVTSPVKTHPLIIDWILDQLQFCGKVPDLLALKYRMKRILLIKEGRAKSETIRCNSGRITLLSGENLDKLCKKVPPVHEPQEIPLPREFPSVKKLNYSLMSMGHKDILSIEVSLESLKADEIPTYNSSKRNFQFKCLPITSSGPYKFASLISEVKMESNSQVICLADGSGGFTRIAALLPSVDHVFYNSLYLGSPGVSQMTPSPYLPSLVDLTTDLRDKVTGYKELPLCISDVTNPFFSESISKYIVKEPILITGDAEIDTPTMEFYIKLFIGYANCCWDLRSKQGLFKTHLIHPNLVGTQIGILLSVFRKVIIYRSHFSSWGNFEIYLYATEPRDKRKPCLLEGSTYKGYSLNNIGINRLYFLQDQLPSFIVHPDSESSNKLTDWMYPSPLAISLPSHLYCFFPWIINLEDDNVIHYPHTIIKWIREFHRGKSSKHLTSMQRGIRSSFSNSEIYTLMISFLVVYLSGRPSDEVEAEFWAEQLVENGILVWYKTKSMDWSFSIGLLNPHIGIPENTWCYKFSNYLKRSSLRLIFKLVGALNIVGYDIVNCSESPTCVEYQTIYKGHLVSRGIPLNPDVKGMFSANPFSSNSEQYRKLLLLQKSRVRRS